MTQKRALVEGTLFLAPHRRSRELFRALTVGVRLVPHFSPRCMTHRPLLVRIGWNPVENPKDLHRVRAARDSAKKDLTRAQENLAHFEAQRNHAAQMVQQYEDELERAESELKSEVDKANERSVGVRVSPAAVCPHDCRLTMSASPFSVPGQSCQAVGRCAVCLSGPPTLGY